MSFLPVDTRLILASESPRRQEILRSAGLTFDVVSKEHREEYSSSLKHKDIPIFLSQEKAKPFKGEGVLSENDVVVTADTIVWIHDTVLGKPGDRQEAFEMIRELAGNTHEVITGVTLLSKRGERSFYDITKVTFDTISSDDIYHYIDNYQPYDKAGAYGIQEWIGLVACSRIEGSFFNVMGLPINKLLSELRLFLQEERR